MKKIQKIIFSNESECTYSGNITKKAKTDIPTKYLLGELNGPDGIMIADRYGMPIGVITDEAFEGDDINVALLGCAETLKMVAQESIPVGSILVVGANGKVKALPVSAGTYFQIGIALNSAVGDGKIVEVLSCVPQKLIIVAA